MRAVAVDWSGARVGAERRIWTAEAVDGELVELADGRSRSEVADHLIALAAAEPDLVAGLDFSFSVPAWYAAELGARSAREVWRAVASEGERWLSECPWPFFGARGTRRPEGVELLRRTEREVAGPAKSVFQIAGSGQVGPGSIRGMPLLARLADAGFAVWPFDSPTPGRPLLVEVYPRLLTGPVVKRDGAARREALERYSLPDRLHERAAGSEDAFDAAVSAVEMARRPLRAELAGARDAVDRIEGRIWEPG